MKMHPIAQNVADKLLDGLTMTDKAIIEATGKRFSSVLLLNDEMLFDFGSERLKISDNGQSCCESRYMTCDDDLTQFTDCIFQGVLIKDATSTGDVHETQFLEVLTNKGSITCAMHNEHNGYYGGFNLNASLAVV